MNALPAASTGLTPLHLACEMGHLEVVRLLLEASATLEPMDSEGLRPLHTAAKRGHLEVLEELLERKAMIDALDRAWE